MPRTKSKPNSASPPAPPALPVVKGPVEEVLTLAEAAAYLRLPEADVLQLVHEQDLPGRQSGKEWRFFKKAIHEWLSQPVAKPNKDFWTASVGAWKDDPQAEELLKAIDKRRGRP